MCIAVATGGSVWEYAANSGKALYLALEDNHRRLQSRVNKILAEEIDLFNLKSAVCAKGIHNGLVEQVNRFITANPDTRLIVIDTLEKIRNGKKLDNAYSLDCDDIGRLRKIVDNRGLTLLLVHHNRKMHDDDPLNMISGSTGLTGSTDGNWVLLKERRIGDKARLTIANRDTHEYCFSLSFNRDECRWEKLGEHTEANEPENHDEFTYIIKWLERLLEDGKFSGTAEELFKKLNTLSDGLLEFWELNAQGVSRKLSANSGRLSEHGIGIRHGKNHIGRRIFIWNNTTNDENADPK
jgi:RecA-family ATPase